MSHINWDQWKFYLDVAQWVYVIALTLWVTIDNGRKDNRRLLGAQEQRLNNLDSRLTTVERDLEHMPSKDRVANLDSKLTGVEAQLESIGPQLSQVQNQLSMLIENELRGSSRQ